MFLRPRRLLVTVAEERGLEVLALSPEGLQHKARAPAHGGVHLGRWVYPGQSGIAFHGTDLQSFIAVLRDRGLLR